MVGLRGRCGLAVRWHTRPRRGAVAGAGPARRCRVGRCDAPRWRRRADWGLSQPFF